MSSSISEAVVDGKLYFSMWDCLSYSDASLPFGDIVSADQVRELFADQDALFGSGEHDVWNTGLTLWSFNVDALTRCNPCKMDMLGLCADGRGDPVLDSLSECRVSAFKAVGLGQELRFE